MVAIQLIEAEWRVYASIKHAIILLDNGLTPVRRQDIIWTNADFVNRIRGNKSSKLTIFIQEFFFENVFKIVAS